MSSLTAMVLSGGFSRRMGSEKGLVPFKGRSMIELALEKAMELTDNIMIIANNEGYDDFGYPVHKDILIDKGPIGGIHAGLTQSDTENNLVLACDMPLMNVAIFKHLIGEINTEYEVIVPRYKGRLEPLCAIYHKSCLPLIEEAAKSTDLSLHAFIRGRMTKIIEVNEQSPYYSPYLFSNANTKEELAALELINQ